MSKEQPIEIFMPPNMLKAKIGGHGRGLDTAAIRRAEQALDELKDEFGDWITSEVEVLSKSHGAFKASPTAETRGALFRSSHDLRGQALTYEFPLVARVATSLCKLLEAEDIKAPPALVDAHVDAIRVIVHQNVKDADDKTGNALASELDTNVAKFLAASGKV
jgi:hypothetical protein